MGERAMGWYDIRSPPLSWVYCTRRGLQSHTSCKTSCVDLRISTGRKTRWLARARSSRVLSHTGQSKRCGCHRDAGGTHGDLRGGGPGEQASGLTPVCLPTLPVRYVMGIQWDSCRQALGCVSVVYGMYMAIYNPATSDRKWS